jgi:hypothetical protein
VEEGERWRVDRLRFEPHGRWRRRGLYAHRQIVQFLLEKPIQVLIVQIGNRIKIVVRVCVHLPLRFFQSINLGRSGFSFLFNIKTFEELFIYIFIRLICAVCSRRHAVASAHSWIGGAG